MRRTEELYHSDWFLARQFRRLNPAYHASTTGPEILRDLKATDSIGVLVGVPVERCQVQVAQQRDPI